MPLVYQQNINEATKLGIWHITETEFFFLNSVPLQQKIMHPHKRLQHLAGRFLLRELFPNFPTELIQIANTRKPFLQNKAFHFSISHCGNYAAAIVSKTNRVGVDVEEITEKAIKIIPKFLSQQEVNILLQDDLKKWATLFWCVKETIFKWKSTELINFKNDIVIKKIDEAQQIIFCLFEKKTKLNVNYLGLNNLVLTWIIT